jgi:hypothetical protein
MKANQENEVLFLNKVRTGQLVVRDDGTVLNAYTNKVYGPRKKDGVVCIAAKVNGRTRHMLASRLVYAVTFGLPDPDKHIIHLDGNKTNNRPDNLEQMDDSDAALFVHASGRSDMAKLSRSLKAYYQEHWAPNARLSQEQVNEIRRRAASGERRWALAKEFKMSWKDMAKLVSGEHYKNLSAVP